MPENNTNLQDGDLTYRIIGCAMKVHTALGPGLREKPYERALAIEFEEEGIAFTQQPCFLIFYRDRPVGDCQPDFVVEDDSPGPYRRSFKSMKSFKSMFNPC